MAGGESTGKSGRDEVREKMGARVLELMGHCEDFDFHSE